MEYAFRFQIFLQAVKCLAIYLNATESLIEQSLYAIKINVMFKCTSALIRLFDYHIHVLKSSLECTQVVLKIS